MREIIETCLGGAVGSLTTKQRKNKTHKQKTFLFCSLTHIYTTIFIRGSCVRRVYMFSLRELGPNLSHIDFIKNVNALLVNSFVSMLCVGCRDVSSFFSFFCPFVLLSARTNHFIIIEILISCFFYGPKKIFMAMNKHWQVFSFFPFVFISCKYFVARVCSPETLRGCSGAEGSAAYISKPFK